MAKRNAYEVYKSLQRSGNAEKSLKERNKQNNIVDLYNFLEERNARDGVRGASFEDNFIGSLREWNYTKDQRKQLSTQKDKTDGGTESAAVHESKTSAAPEITKDEEETLNKYGLNPTTFSNDDFKKWAEEHNFEYRLGGSELTGKEYKWLPKQKGGLKFWETLTTDEEEKDKKVLERFIEKKNVQKNAEKHPVITSAATVLTAPVRGIAGGAAVAQDSISKAFGKRINTNTTAHNVVENSDTVRQTVTNEHASKWFGGAGGKLGNYGALAYNGLMSMGDSLMVAATTKGIGERIGLTGKALAAFTSNATSGLLASTSGASTIIEKKKDGLSDGKAVLNGLASAASEFITERISLNEIFNTPTSMIKKGIRSFLAEGSEEVASDIITKTADYFISGNDSDIKKNINQYIQSGMSKKDAIKQATTDSIFETISAGLVGGISGVAMSTMYHGFNRPEIKRLGKDYRSIAPDIIQSGLEAPENSTAYKYAKKLSEKGINNITDYELGLMHVYNVEQVGYEDEKEEKAFKKAAEEESTSVNANAENNTEVLPDTNEVPARQTENVQAFPSNVPTETINNNIPKNTVSVNSNTDGISENAAVQTSNPVALKSIDDVITHSGGDDTVKKTVSNNIGAMERAVSESGRIAIDRAVTVVKNLSENISSTLKNYTGKGGSASVVYPSVTGTMTSGAAIGHNDIKAVTDVFMNVLQDREKAAITDMAPTEAFANHIETGADIPVNPNVQRIYRQFAARSLSDIVTAKTMLFGSSPLLNMQSEILKSGDTNAVARAAAVSELNNAVSTMIRPNLMSTKEFIPAINSSFGGMDGFTNSIIVNYMKNGSLGNTGKIFTDNGERITNLLNIITGGNNNGIYTYNSSVGETGSYTGGQVRRVAEGTGGNTKWQETANVTGNGAGAQKAFRNLNHVEMTVGKYNISADIISNTEYTPEMKRVEEHGRKNGKEVLFCSGTLNINGENAYGVNLGDRYILQADNNTYSIDNLYEHEDAHTAFRSTPERMKKIMNIIRNSLSVPERMNAIQQLKEDYSKVSDGKSDYLWEEFICNTLSGMNEYSTRFEKLIGEYKDGSDVENIYSPEQYANSIDSGGESAADDVTVRYSVASDNNLGVKEQINKYSDSLKQMDPVFDDEVNITNQGKVKNKEWILPMLEKLDYKIQRNDIGTIVTDKKRISSSLRYMKTDAEVAAYSALPYVLKNGEIFGHHSDHKNRGYDTVTIMAPVVINGVRGNMGAVVRLSEDGNFYKVHRIIMPDGSVFVYENKNSSNAERAAASYKTEVTSPAVAATDNSISQNNTVVNSNNMQNTEENIQQNDENDIRLAMDKAENKKKVSIDDYSAAELLQIVADEHGLQGALVKAAKRNYGEVKSLLKQNESLKESIDTVRNEMRRSKSPKVNLMEVSQNLKELLNDFGSKTPLKDIGEKTAGIYNQYLTEMKNAHGIEELESDINQRFITELQDVAEEIVNGAEIEVPNEDFAALKAYLQNTEISLPDEYKSDVHWNEFRKKNMGRLKLTNNGVSADKVYNELEYMFPYLFNSREHMDIADQLQHISDVYDDLKPDKYNPYEGNLSEAIDYVTERLAHDAATVGLQRTKADKMYERAKEQRTAAIERTKQRYEERLMKQKERYQSDKALQKKKLDDQKYIGLWNNMLAKEDKKEAVNAVKADKAEALQRANEQRAADIERTKQTIRERQRAQLLRTRIRTIHNDFSKKLNNPSPTSHIPRELVQAVADVCSRLDFTTSRTSVKTNLKLAELKSAYDSLKNDSDYDFVSEYRGELSEKIGMLSRVTGDKKVADLTPSELEDLYYILKEIQHTVAFANKQIGRDTALTNIQLGNSIISDFKNMRGKGENKLYGRLINAEFDLTNTMRCVRVISGFNENNELYKLFDDINKGARKTDKFIMDASKPFDTLINSDSATEKLYKRFTIEELETPIKDTNGNNVKLTKNMICNILLLWERKQGRTHLMNGGMTIPDIKEMQKGNLSKALTENQIRTQPISQSNITALKGMIDNYDRRWMDSAKHYFNVIAKDALNETYLDLHGYKIAHDDNYFPIITDKNFIRTYIDGLVSDLTIEGWGALKSTTPNAKQPAVITGVSDVVKSHIGNTAKVYGLAIPIRNFNKVYNVSIRNDNGSLSSVKESLGKTWGSFARGQIIEQAIKDLQTSRSAGNGDGLTKFIRTLDSNWVASTLNANISVSIKQFASYPTAGYVLGMKPLVKALNGTFHLRDTINEIDKYTGLHYKRRLGLSTQELGDLAQNGAWVKSFMLGAGKMINLPKEINPINWVQSVDCYTTALLWDASKYYVADELGISRDSENFFEKVTEVYEKTIEETQPNYDVLHRAEFAKDPNAAKKLFFKFMTQPLQNTGILHSSFGNYIAKANEYKTNKNTKTEKAFKEASGEFKRAVLSQFATAVMFAAFTFIGGGLSLHKLKKYADEDGKITLASVGKCILNESVSGLAAAVMPFANDINDLKNGYDAEIPIMKTFSDVVSCIGEIKKISGEHSGVKRYMPADEKLKEWEKALYTASGLVGDITGVPVRNLTNIVRGTMLYAKDVQNGNGLTTNQSITDYGKTEAPKKVYSYHDLTAAILSENTKKEKIIKDYLIDYDKEYGDYTDKKKPKKDIDHIDKGSMTKDLKQNILWLHEQGEDEKIEKLIEKLHEEYGYKPKTIRGWIKEADKKKREEEKN